MAVVPCSPRWSARRGGSRQTWACRRDRPCRAPDRRLGVRPLYFSAQLLILVLLCCLIARLVTGWIRQPRAQFLVAGGSLTLLIGRPISS
jgi:hypothetical protein